MTARKAILIFGLLWLWPHQAQAAFTVFSHDYNGSVFVDYYGNIYWPKTKIAFGPDGSATDVTTSSPFPVGIEVGGLQVDPRDRNWHLLNTTDSVTAVGNVASGSADSGNPVKIAGVYNSTLPTLSTGQRGDIQLSARGAQIISGASPAGSAPIDAPVSVSGVDGGGLKRSLLTDTAGRQNVLLNGASQTSLPAPVANGVNTIQLFDPYSRILLVSEDSIDSRWGIMFSTTTDVVSAGTTAEFPFLLWVNPLGSGKNIRLYQWTFSSTIAQGEYTTYRCYLDPTVTANGTALTILGKRQTNQATTIAQAYRAPTVTANGTLFKALSSASGNTEISGVGLTRWLEPGHSILCTTKQKANNDVSGIQVEWVEE